MPVLVRAFPVSSRAAVDQFASELRERSEETRRFYRHFGIRRESWFFRQLPSGSFVVGITDIEDPVPEKAADYANTTDAFALWFQRRILEISGVDQHEQPLGPETECLYDSLATTADANLTVRMTPLNEDIAPLRTVASGLGLAGAGDGEACYVQNIAGSPHAITISSRHGGDMALSTRLGVADVPPSEHVFDFRS